MSTTANDGELNLKGLPLVIDYKNIAEATPEEYVSARRNGLGTSDSSIVLGVNPYQNLDDLIASKLRTEITEEERLVSEKTAVRKGKELEPLIIEKWIKFFKMNCIKPIHQYSHKDFPYMKFNFDGVQDTPEQYIPVEIKVVTAAGMKHYDFTKAMFDEATLSIKPLPDNHAITTNSIETKAALYGIPPYYYTQLQQQILGLNAPYGYLCILCDKDWYLRTYYVHRDEKVITDLIVVGSKVWTKIEQLRQNKTAVQALEQYDKAENKTIEEQEPLDL